MKKRRLHTRKLRGREWWGISAGKMCVRYDSTVPFESVSLSTTFSAAHSQDETNAKSNQKGRIKKSRRGKLCDISLSDSYCVTLFSKSSHTFQVAATSGFIISCRGITNTHTHTFYDLILSLKKYEESCEMSTCHFAASSALNCKCELSYCVISLLIKFLSAHAAEEASR